MLDLASLGNTQRPRFAFGGTVFEIVAPSEVAFRLSEEFERVSSCDAGMPTTAEVRCSVSVDPSLPLSELRGLTIECTGGKTRIAHRLISAEMWPVSSGRYEARARIAPHHLDGGTIVRGPDGVVAGLAAAIAEERGGLLMHAAAIEFAGCAVLFLGPSGAGKSTAMQLVEGARVLAFDRVSVVRDSSGAYTVWALPGGGRVDVPRSARRALPLGAILRVRRGRGSPGIVATSGAKALFAIRESTEVGDRSPVGEARRLTAGLELASHCRTGEIYTVLGAPHRALLSGFLGARAQAHALDPDVPDVPGVPDVPDVARATCDECREGAHACLT